MLRIQILASSNALADWPLALGERLRRRGYGVGVVRVLGAPAPPGLRLLLMLERMLFRTGLETSSEAPPPLEAADVVVDLSGKAPADVKTPTLYPLFDGAPGDAAAANALLERRAPRIDVILLEPEAAPRRIATATPALETREKFTPSYRAVAAAAAALLAEALRRRCAGSPFACDEPAAAEMTSRAASALTFFTGTLAQKTADRLTRLAAHKEHFRIGWRRAQLQDCIAQTLAWPSAPYNYIPDDGGRFFADPFVFAKGGRRYIFCEEYPYATGKGVLSLFELFADGRISAARPVMEQPYHLSYPQIFERDGDVWMIPETSAANRIELYRAERFPDIWRREAILIDGVRAADATLVEHAGRLWLFATAAQDGLSDWDALHIFSADRLQGPWRAHAANPVLIDASAARPAGPMFYREGALWRPAQDCSLGYGGGLTLCSVDRLDDAEFRQTPRTRLKPPAHWAAHGAHMLHHAEDVEVIDLVGRRSR